MHVMLPAEGVLRRVLATRTEPLMLLMLYVVPVMNESRTVIDDARL